MRKRYIEYAQVVELTVGVQLSGNYSLLMTRRQPTTKTAAFAALTGAR
ncbi:MAG: hypothetical protein ACQEXV_24870 [Bacillota bacterium]